jgi:Trk-type K+ transport systems, membrane components
MINFKPITFVIGLSLSKLALFMWLPFLVAFFTGTAGTAEFLASAVLTHAIALLLTRMGYQQSFRLSVRDMFVLTTLVWVIMCMFASLPFLFLSKLSFTDAYFEAMSGITTTGSTVLQGLDKLTSSHFALAFITAMAGWYRDHHFSGSGTALSEYRRYETIPDGIFRSHGKRLTTYLGCRA